MSFYAARVGQRKVEDGHVGAAFLVQAVAFRGIAGFADDAQVAAPLQEPAVAFPHHGVIVHQQETQDFLMPLPPGRRQGNAHPHQGSPGLAGFQAETAAQGLHPLVHAEDAQAPFGGQRDFAVAVVAHREFDLRSPGERTSTSPASPWRVALVRLSWTMR